MFWRAGYRPRDADGPCGCCTSCHEDANMGYADMCQGTFRGREYEVCCRMAEALKGIRLDQSQARASIMTIERFEDYAITVTQPYSHNLHFEVRKVVGETLDPPPAGLWMYELEGAASSAETTTDFNESEPFLSGDVKWDGCSNWDFHDDEVMVHFCRHDQAAGLGRLLDHLYQIAKERLEMYEGD